MNHYPQQRAVSKGMRVGITIVSLFLPLIGIVWGIVYMTSQNQEKKSVGLFWLLWSLFSTVLYIVGVCIIFLVALEGASGRGPG